MLIDFTAPRWGHAMHSRTFMPAQAETLLQHFRDWYYNHRRYTVVVHSELDIRKGDSIRYRTDSGLVEVKVENVKYFRDPKDMAKIEFVIKGKPNAE